ncbi:MAG TPA: aldose 1-epimerase family protein [Panacibacter sp.]|nr:aldose 1-epimerase family protein [Panacibacter sp.]HNP43823.1 aldose 1-epimerase family protein [Panacibacter sp.]
MAGNIFSIQNELLHVSVAAKGAELQSLIHKKFGIEYMWSGDPKFWGKKSPVLFPVVGGLKQNHYTYNNIQYELGRHGFARDMDFDIAEQTENSLTFTLVSNAATEKLYPFPFQFSVKYSLDNTKLHVNYTVKNTGEDVMYFSVGAHPAFRVPLVENTTFNDYYLEFDHAENKGRWPLSPDGQIENFVLPCLENTNLLPLRKQLFYEDALVFKKLSSTSIAIKSNKTTHGLKLSFPHFPYMGIWNAKDADFVCIEPWCGIADHVNASGVISEKEGINKLQPEHVFNRIWTVDLF